MAGPSINFREFWGATGQDNVFLGTEDGGYVVFTGGVERGRITSSGVGSGVFGIAVFAPAPSGDTTGVTDTAALQAAINATPSGGKLFIPFQGSPYWLNGGLTITNPITIEVGGDHSTGNPAFKTVTGAVGPFININPGALIHGVHLKGVYLDLSNTTGQVGIYAKNIDNSYWERCFVRDGATAYQLDGIQLTTLRDCIAFNQRTQGFYSSGASNVDIRFDNCVYEQTIGATWGATAGWNLAAGASFGFYMCEALRSPTGTGNWLNYGLTVTSTAATTWIFALNCWFDAVSDGTGANSANSAALNLTSNTVNARLTNCFFSASSSAGQKQRAVRVNGGSDHQFINCTFGGSGIEFANGNCSRMGVTNCNFVQQFGDAAISFVGGAAPVQGTFANNTLASASAGVVGSAADATSFNTWTQGANTDA